ncbi:MAG: respiratory nitrate reductase subunit gamma [Acidobacteriota bacterium]
MNIAVYGAIDLGLLVFLIGCLLRIREYARTPYHLRWELYPVPHEAPQYAEHGGSYFESAEWWRKPQEQHHLPEWLAMLQEILLLRSLWESNRRLWFSSFCLHLGLYLSIAAAILTVLAGVLPTNAAPPPIVAGVASSAVWVGVMGAVFIVDGAVLLLINRLRDPGLRNYTKPADIFNLLCFVLTFGLLIVGTLMSRPTASTVDIVRGALRFDLSLSIQPWLGVGLICASALTAYIPFTHMSHFIAKYFTWHEVRWDDRRMERGGALERRMAANLQLRPTWSAKHMGADGRRSWADIATSDPRQEVRK